MVTASLLYRFEWIFCLYNSFILKCDRIIRREYLYLFYCTVVLECSFKFTTPLVLDNTILVRSAGLSLVQRPGPGPRWAPPFARRHLLVFKEWCRCERVAAARRVGGRHRARWRTGRSLESAPASSAPVRPSCCCWRQSRARQTTCLACAQSRRAPETHCAELHRAAQRPAEGSGRGFPAQLECLQVRLKYCTFVLYRTRTLLCSYLCCCCCCCVLFLRTDMICFEHLNKSPFRRALRYPLGVSHGVATSCGRCRRPVLIGSAWVSQSSMPSTLLS